MFLVPPGFTAALTGVRRLSGAGVVEADHQRGACVHDGQIDPGVRASVMALIGPDGRLVPWAIGALAMLAIVAFAGNSLLTRAALAGDLIGPAEFGQIRLASGAVALVIFALASGRAALPRRADLPGGLALAIYTAGFSFAYVRLDAGSGALILFAAVSATVVLASLRSGIQWVELAGLALALTGLVWLLLPGAGRVDLLPAGLMAAAGIAWGGYTLIGRQGGEPVGRTARSFVLASLFLLPALLIGSTTASTPAGITIAIVCGVVTSAAGYSVWYLCLPRLPVIASGSVQLATPAVAALGGIVFLGEPMTGRLVLAGLLILAGVGVTLLRPPSKK